MNPTKALIYTRVSSERQKKEGHGLESQEHRCRADAEYNGLEVEKVFFDSFTGGGNFMKRPAMAELLTYLDEHSDEKYVVIFDDLKRFARDVIFHFQLRTELQSRGAVVRCLNFNFEDTPEGHFIETVFAAHGELERKQNRRQVMQKMKARLEKGYWAFNAPAGYTYTRDPAHGKLLVPDGEKAIIIKEALEGFASGRFPNQIDVQKFLEMHKLLGKKPIYLEYVKRLLMRSIYAGHIEYEEWGITRRMGHHMPLISPETYDLIEEKLTGRTNLWTRKDMCKDFPLRGLVCCASCDRVLTASWSTGRHARYAYYRCQSRECIYRNVSIPKNMIEGNFLNVLSTVRTSDEVFISFKARAFARWQKRAQEVGAILKRKEKELETIEHDIAVLVEMIPATNSLIVRKTYETKIEVLAKQAEKIRNKGQQKNNTQVSYGTAFDLVFEYLKNPYEKWINGTFNVQRLVFKLVFDAPLYFDLNMGYGTAKLSCPLKVIGEFSTSNSHYVDIKSTSWNNPEIQNEVDWEEFENEIMKMAELISHNASP